MEVTLSEHITFTTNLPIAFEGADDAQLADDGQVYTWNASMARFMPTDNLERLVTHDTGAGHFELVFHSDGSPLWH
jgi:hypothetical protein